MRAEGLSLKRVLFIRTDRLGETLLNIPAVQSIKQAYPEVRVTWMVNPQLVGLLEDLPGVDAVVAEPFTDKLWWQAAWFFGCRWRLEKVDAVIVSNAKKLYHLASFLGGVPIRAGYDRKWGFLLTHRIADQKMIGTRHEVECHFDLLKPLGISADVPADLALPVKPQTHEAVLKRLEEKGIALSKPLVAVHPWTSNAAKQWALERFRGLIDRIIEGGSREVAVIGGPEHASESSAFKRLSGVHDLTGFFSLPELAAFLQRARVVISNDSGPAHVAAAVGVPVIALFGTQDAATGPARWGPWGAKHTVIWKKSMDEIAVDEVFEATMRYL